MLTIFFCCHIYKYMKLDLQATGSSLKQLQVENCPDVKHLFLCGAARGGKTYCSIKRFIYKLIDVKKYNDDCAIITKTSATFLRNFYKPLQEILDSSLYELNFYKKFIKICGVVCWLIPANDRSFDDKIKGATLSAVYVDELTTLPKERWWLINTRMAKHYSMIISTSNPSTKLHYVKREILDVEKAKGDPESFRYFHFVLDDNPTLSEADKEQFKKKFRGVMYERYILGNWVQDTGRVYDFVKNEYVMEEEPDTPQRYFIGIDFGACQPFAAVLFGEHPDTSPRVWACDEIYFSSVEMDQQQKTATEYAHMIDKKWGHLQSKIDLVYIDAEHGRLRSILESFSYKTAPAKNDLTKGIELVSDMMYSGEYKIYQKCERLIEEKESYCWREQTQAMKGKGREEVIREQDDTLDAERIALYTRYREKGYRDEKPEPAFRHGLIHNEVMREMDMQYFSETPDVWERYY